MRTRWFELLSALALAGVLTCVGCGKTTAPEDAQTSEEYTKEVKTEDPSLRGEKPADLNAPDKQPAEKPAEKPEG